MSGPRSRSEGSQAVPWSRYLLTVIFSKSGLLLPSSLLIVKLKLFCYAKASASSLALQEEKFGEKNKLHILNFTRSGSGGTQDRIEWNSRFARTGYRAKTKHCEAEGRK